MNDEEKSDPAIVAGKPPSNAGPPVAEEVEPRACPCEGARGVSHLVSVPFQAVCLDVSGKSAPCRGGR